MCYTEVTYKIKMLAINIPSTHFKRPRELDYYAENNVSFKKTRTQEEVVQRMNLASRVRRSSFGYAAEPNFGSMIQVQQAQQAYLAQQLQQVQQEQHYYGPTTNLMEYNLKESDQEPMDFGAAMEASSMEARTATTAGKEKHQGEDMELGEQDNHQLFIDTTAPYFHGNEIKTCLFSREQSGCKGFSFEDNEVQDLLTKSRNKRITW
jgi:hypothetical protein